MNRGFLPVSLLVAALLAAVPARGSTRNGTRSISPNPRIARPASPDSIAGQPHGPAQAHQPGRPHPQVHPREPGRPQTQVRPPAPARRREPASPREPSPNRSGETGERVRPEPTPRPVFAEKDKRESPTPMLPPRNEGPTTTAAIAATMTTAAIASGICASPSHHRSGGLSAALGDAAASKTGPGAALKATLTAGFRTAGTRTSSTTGPSSRRSSRTSKTRRFRTAITGTTTAAGITFIAIAAARTGTVST